MDLTKSPYKVHAWRKEEEGGGERRAPNKAGPMRPTLLNGIKWEWDILGISLTNLGHILGISWVYLRNILGISWSYLGHILDIFWPYLGHKLGHILGISLA